MKTEFLNHRIGENLASNPLNLGMGRSRIERVGQSNYKIFSLPHVLNTLVLHLPKSAVDGLALRVQNRLLERDIDMSLHFA